MHWQVYSRPSCTVFYLQRNTSTHASHGSNDEFNDARSLPESHAANAPPSYVAAVPKPSHAPDSLCNDSFWRPPWF